MNLYQKISDDLRQAIVTERLKPGDKIYSINEMKARYDVSQVTAMRVYRELSSDGLVECHRGQGYYVCEQGGGPQTIQGRFACFVRTMRPLQADDNYFDEINIGIQNEAARRHVDLVLPSCASLLDNQLLAPGMLDELRRSMEQCADRVDGFLMDERLPDSLLEEVMNSLKKPMVLVNRKTELPINMVYNDNAGGVKTMLDVGRKMKYDQFIFCARANGHLRSAGYWNNLERMECFQQLVTEADGEVVEDCLVMPTNQMLAAVGEAVSRRQRKGRVLVICVSDNLGAQLCAHFFPQGKALPDLGICGLDGLPVGKLGHPRLTTMKIDTLSMGCKAVELLQQSVNGQYSYVPRTCAMASTLVLGESVL